MSEPWGGYGSPCGNLALQRRRKVWHGRYPQTPPPVVITFPDLADCRECLMCGGCETHEGCASDWNHIAWHARFASPGERPCGHQGTTPGGLPGRCALTDGHGGEWHQELGGAGWRVVPA